LPREIRRFATIGFFFAGSVEAVGDVDAGSTTATVFAAAAVDFAGVAVAAGDDAGAIEAAGADASVGVAPLACLAERSGSCFAEPPEVASTTIRIATHAPAAAIRPFLRLFGVGNTVASNELRSIRGSVGSCRAGTGISGALPCARP